MSEIDYAIDETLQEDLKIVAGNTRIFNELANSSIMITGATGLIGSFLTRAIITSNKINKSNIKIIALVRDLNKAKDVFGPLYENEHIQFAVADITQNIEINEKIDYLIHTASITSSKDFINKPVKTINTMVNGTENILKLALKHNIKSLVYLSSMEVYGITDPDAESISEDDLGYIDFLNVRSSYSEGKRMAECLCAAYANQYALNIKIARLAQTFGAGVRMSENRVFAQFAKSVIFNEDIILNTSGKSMGNYCYISDSATALLLLLVAGESGNAYNISNEASNISIRNMANLVASKIANNEIKVIVNDSDKRNEFGYAPDVKMKLNSEKMRLLGWEPEVNLEDSYRRMIKSMKLRLASDFS